MLQVKNVSKYFGAQTLFSDISFAVGPTEKIGLIGRNGTGKTTLFKILLDEEAADEGSIETPPQYHIAALTQHLSFTKQTVLEEVCQIFENSEVENTWKAKSMLMGLGFLESEFQKSPTAFSGGYQIRIRLAQALLSEPDLLLLDEPTNYLDIISLRWLEEFLKTWKKSFLLITHDVHFMERVVESTLALHRGKLKRMKGGPKKLMQQIAQDEEVYEKTRQNQEKKKAAQEEFIRTFRAGARSAGLVQSRIKSLEKQEIAEKLDFLPTIHFQFPGELFRGNIMIEAKNITFGYENNTALFSKFSMSMLPYEKIGIVGKNGKGKTTMLNILAGKMMPQSGHVRILPTLSIGYFGSESFESLSPEKTLLEEVITATKASEQQVRGILGSLLFSGDTVKKKIKALSGGEKNRACMAKLLLAKHHVLILDEPTNHLDLESCLALIEALKKFNGAIIVVSHDEYLLSQVATQLIVFDNQTVQIRSMGYDEFLKTHGWTEDAKPTAISSISDNKQEYLEQKQQQKRKRQAENLAKKTEEMITQRQETIQKISEKLIKASSKKNIDDMKSLGKEIKDIQKEIDDLYAVLEKTFEEIDSIPL